MLHFLIKLKYELSDIHLQDLCTCGGKSEHLDCDTAWNEEVESLDTTCTDMCFNHLLHLHKDQQHSTLTGFHLQLSGHFVMCA